MSTAHTLTERPSIVGRLAAGVSDVAQSVRDYGPALLPRGRTAGTRFVIMTTGRTGSELLVSLLDSHPSIRCVGEILRDGRTFPTAYVQARAAAAALRGNDAFGFKLLLSQFRSPAGTVHGIGAPERYPAHLHELGFRLVHLARANPVMQAISVIVGADRQFHYRGRQDAPFVPITIDPVRLIAAAWIIEADTTALAQIMEPVPHLALHYERDLLSSDRHQATVDRVCGFLGVAAAPVSSALVKVAPARPQESLANYDEVAAVLSQTRFARYLNDGGALT